MMLENEQNCSVAHLCFGFALLRFVSFNLIERLHSTDEQRHNRAEDYVRLLNIGAREQCKGQKRFFVLF